MACRVAGSMAAPGFASAQPESQKVALQYARLVSSWVATIGLDPHFFGTHSLRRTKATLIYRRTGNLRAVQLLLGHTAYCPRTPDGSQGPLPLPSAIR